MISPLQVTRRRGFTLLELLIAMSLIGLLLGLLYGGFKLGVSSWDRGQARSERLDSLRLAQAFIRRQLRQSTTVYRADEDAGRVLYFLGEPDRVGWVAPMLHYLDLGGLYYMELDHVSSEDSGHLRIRWFPYHPADTDDLIDGDDVEHTVLIEGVRSLQIDYFGPGEQFDDDPEWTDEWTNPQLRPSAVRLAVDLVDMKWPTLTVPVVN